MRRCEGFQGFAPLTQKKNTAYRDPVSLAGPPVVFSVRARVTPSTSFAPSHSLFISSAISIIYSTAKAPAKVRIAFIDLRTFASRRHGPRSGRYPMKRKPPDWSREREPSRTHDATDRRRIGPGRYKQSVGRCLQAGDNRKRRAERILKTAPWSAQKRPISGFRTARRLLIWLPVAKPVLQGKPANDRRPHRINCEVAHYR